MEFPGETWRWQPGEIDVFGMEGVLASYSFDNVNIRWKKSAWEKTCRWLTVSRPTRDCIRRLKSQWSTSSSSQNLPLRIPWMERFASRYPQKDRKVMTFTSGMWDFTVTIFSILSGNIRLYSFQIQSPPCSTLCVYSTGGNLWCSSTLSWLMDSWMKASADFQNNVQ